MQAPVGNERVYISPLLQMNAGGQVCERFRTKFVEPGRAWRCSGGMNTFLNKARDWRRRAGELRRTADRVLTPAARASLLDRAAALDHHAENIEQVTAKFRDIRETAATGDAFRDFVLRRAVPRGQEGD